VLKGGGVGGEERKGVGVKGLGRGERNRKKRKAMERAVGGGKFIEAAW